MTTPYQLNITLPYKILHKKYMNSIIDHDFQNIENLTTEYLTKIVLSEQSYLLKEAFETGAPILIKIVDDKGNVITAFKK